MEEKESRYKEDIPSLIGVLNVITSSKRRTGENEEGRMREEGKGRGGERKGEERERGRREKGRGELSEIPEFIHK